MEWQVPPKERVKMLDPNHMMSGMPPVVWIAIPILALIVAFIWNKLR